MAYTPFILGINHEDELLPKAKQALLELKNKGVKTIGLEKSISLPEKEIKALQKQAINEIIHETDLLSREATEKISQFFKHISIIQSRLEIDFFQELFDEAKRIGLEPVFIDTHIIQKKVVAKKVKISLKKKLYTTLLENLKEYDGYFKKKIKELKIADKEIFSSKTFRYANLVHRTKRMQQEAERRNLDALAGGNAHALIWKKELKIPDAKTLWVIYKTGFFPIKAYFKILNYLEMRKYNKLKKWREQKKAFNNKQRRLRLEK